MSRNAVFIALVAVLVFAGIVLFAWEAGNNSQPEPDPSIKILFYATGCPHCANVEQFIQENKIEEKIAFEKREVSNDLDNAKLFLKREAQCQIPEKERGSIPVFWDGTTCIGGDVNIIAYFQQLLAPSATTSTEPVSTTSTK